MIKEFQGEHRFLSNFWRCNIDYGGLPFNSVENAYQASKCADKRDRLQFVDITPGQAKRLGKAVRIRRDWEEIKVAVMRELVRKKFKYNPELREKLLRTGTQPLQEGNKWHDTFWGGRPADRSGAE